MPMKVSEVTAEVLADYLRLDDASEIELSEIKNMMSSAKDYIRAYTGLDDAEIDEHQDITQALHLLVADMFDNRNLHMEAKAGNVNKAVECILSMHSINLL